MEAKEEDERILQQKKEQNRKFVKFTKRRSGLFSKASKFCNMFDAQVAVLVLSKSGRPYAFGHSSVDAVLNRYMPPSEEAGPSVTTGIKVEEPTDQMQGLDENRLQKKRKRDDDVDEEHKTKVEDAQELIHLFEKEMNACQTLEELVSLKQKYMVLINTAKKRLKITSPDSEEGKAQYVSINPIPISKNISPISTLKFERDPHVVDGHHVVEVDDMSRPLWNKGLEDEKAQYVSTNPIWILEDKSPISTLGFESNHITIEDYNSTELGNISQHFWDKDLEASTAQYVSTTPILVSEVKVPNTTQGFETNHRMVEDYHAVELGNMSQPFWDKDLEDGKPLSLSTNPILKFEDKAPTSTLSFESNHRMIEVYHAFELGNMSQPFWNKDWEDDNAQCLSTNPILISEDKSHTSTLDFECDRRMVDDHHLVKLGDTSRSFYDKYVEDNKSVCDSTNPIFISEDESPTSTLGLECNHCTMNDHHVVELGNMSQPIWNGYLECKVQCLSTKPISTLGFEGEHHVIGDTSRSFCDKDVENSKAGCNDTWPNSTLTTAVDNHHGDNGGQGSFSWDKDLENVGSMNEFSDPLWTSMVKQFLGPNDNDLYNGGLNGAFDTAGSSDFAQDNATNGNGGYYKELENIFNDPSCHQDTSSNFD